MPRKADTQPEETTSTLRRSTRATTGSGGTPTPSSIKTRRGSLIPQENDEESVESKATPRTRRAASITKEEPQTKREPAKTRSRRSSASNEPLPTEEKRPATRGRRASTTEASADALASDESATTTSRKTVRSRRNSAQDDIVDDQLVAAKTPQRRKSVNSENEAKPKVTRSRRLSTEKSEEVNEEPTKRATRSTRRGSVDKSEEEPEAKVLKPGTPKKPRRRPSVTDVVVPLEPIDEQETKITNNADTSPIAESAPSIKLTPVKKIEPKKSDLDLSIINEFSFVEEAEPSPNKSQSSLTRSAKAASTSPKESLNNSPTEKLRYSKDPKSPKEPTTTAKSPKEASPSRSSKDQSNIQLTPIKVKYDKQLTPEHDVSGEGNKTASDLTPIPTALLKDDGARLGVRKVSPRLDKKSLTPQKLVFTENEDKEKTLWTKNTEDNSDLGETTATQKPSDSLISSESVGEHTRRSRTSKNNTETRISAGFDIDLTHSSDSDKENSSDSREMKDTEVKTKTNISLSTTGSVFAPKNIECSFVEPMEVDQTFVDTNTKLDVGEDVKKDDMNKDTEVTTNVPSANNGDDDNKAEDEKKGDNSMLEVSFKSTEENTSDKIDAVEQKSDGKTEPASSIEETSTSEEVLLNKEAVPTILITPDKPQEVRESDISVNGKPLVNTNKDDASEDFVFNIPSDEENEDERTNTESKKAPDLPKETKNQTESVEAATSNDDKKIKEPSQEKNSEEDNPQLNEKESNVNSEEGSGENQLVTIESFTECQKPIEETKLENAVTENKEVEIDTAENAMEIEQKSMEDSEITEVIAKTDEETVMEETSVADDNKSEILDSKYDQKLLKSTAKEIDDQKETQVNNTEPLKPTETPTFDDQKESTARSKVESSIKELEKKSTIAKETLELSNENKAAAKSTSLELEECPVPNEMSTVSEETKNKTATKSTPQESSVPNETSTVSQENETTNKSTPSDPEESSVPNETSTVSEENKTTTKSTPLAPEPEKRSAVSNENNAAAERTPSKSEDSSIPDEISAVSDENIPAAESTPLEPEDSSAPNETSEENKSTPSEPKNSSAVSNENETATELTPSEPEESSVPEEMSPSIGSEEIKTAAKSTLLEAEDTSVPSGTSTVSTENKTDAKSTHLELEETSVPEEMPAVSDENRTEESAVSKDTIANGNKTSANSTSLKPEGSAVPKEMSTLSDEKSSLLAPEEPLVPEERSAMSDDNKTAASSTPLNPGEPSVSNEMSMVSPKCQTATECTPLEPEDCSAPKEQSAIIENTTTAAAEQPDILTPAAASKAQSSSPESDVSLLCKEVLLPSSDEDKRNHAQMSEAIKLETATHANPSTGESEETENTNETAEDGTSTTPTDDGNTAEANEIIEIEDNEKINNEIEDGEKVDKEKNSTGVADNVNTDGSVQIVEEDNSQENKPKKKKKNKRKKIEISDAEEISQSDQELSSKKKRARVSTASESLEEEGKKLKKKNKKKNKGSKNKSEIEDDSSLNNTVSSSEVNKSKKKCKKSRKDNDDTDDVQKSETEKSATKKGQYVLSPKILAKLDRFLADRFQNSEEEVENEETDGDRNSFIDDMAEEGEEDTPSEDSNDIVDEGESINTTESEWSNEDYDHNDSFICDEENFELLSGEESYLEDTVETKKKSRIINVDDVDDDVIVIEKKRKKVVNKKPKRSRIINVEDCEDEIIDVDKIISPKRSKRPRLAEKDSSVEDPKVETENQEECLNESDNIPKTEDTETESSHAYVPIQTGEVNSAADDSVNSQSIAYDIPESFEEFHEPTKEPLDQGRLRRASITIQENIKVSDIQDPVLSSRIHQLVNSFSKTIRKGDVSVNLSMQYEGSDSNQVICVDDLNQSDPTKSDRRSSINRSLKKMKEDIDDMDVSPRKKPRLSMSLDDGYYADEDGRPATAITRRSVSIDDIQMKKKRKKKLRKAQKKAKMDLLRGVQEKTIRRRSLSADELRSETFSIMNQLLNDVRNRPRRTVKPSTSKPDGDSSWVIEDITEVKPSTSIVTNKDVAEFKAKKVHIKDFKSQMLNDPSRIRRIDTKTLLKKKWI